jgi:hypothetical protein
LWASLLLILRSEDIARFDLKIREDIAPWMVSQDFAGSASDFCRPVSGDTYKVKMMDESRLQQIFRGVSFSGALMEYGSPTPLPQRTKLLGYL